MVNVLKFLYTKVSDKMEYANSADADQAAPLGAAWSGCTLFAIPQHILRKAKFKTKMYGMKYS